MIIFAMSISNEKGLIMQIKSQEDDGSGSGNSFDYETTKDPRTEEQIYCDELFTHAPDAIKCCKTPIAMISEKDEEECKATFRKPGIPDCYLNSCYYKKLGITRFLIDPEIRPEFIPEGLMQSFLLSVNETDGIWEPVVRRSVNRCFDDLTGYAEGYECFEKIPKMIYEVGFCMHKENFLRCPSWTENPDLKEACDATIKFIKECLF
jgi:hypothetical protein